MKHKPNYIEEYYLWLEDTIDLSIIHTVTHQNSPLQDVDWWRT